MAKTKREKFVQQLKGEWTIAEISIHYKPIFTNQPQVTSVEETYALIRKLWDTERLSVQEQFVAYFFNVNNRFIGYKVISTGTMRSCPVDIKLLCSLALHTLCTFVIIAHNHPSGNTKLSTYDEVVTSKIQQALKLIDVEILDHFIITEDGYKSFAEEGLL